MPADAMEGWVARTQVGIIGAGPAGLVLAHLLADAGITSVVLERHSRTYIESRVRAGLIEHGTADILARNGLGEQMLGRSQEHHGCILRFDGESHRVAYSDLLGGRRMLVYPQQDLVADLVRLALERGIEIVFEAEDVTLAGFSSGEGSARLTYRAANGDGEIDCDFIAGCDGFHGVSRASVPPGALTLYEQALPFGWLGILAAVAPSTDEIIYALHERGFAGHMIRGPEMSRFYLQCDPEDDIANWPDERCWEELQVRLAQPGWTLREGPILEKSISELRSFVCEPMRYGSLFLAGDAAHIVPPTGAKGMNLAIHDAEDLANALSRWYGDGDAGGLDAYSGVCLQRAWRVQEFSTWMSWMIHRLPDDLPDRALRERLQRAQLRHVTGSRAAATAFAEVYVG
jgi:p-hydroxybenzoate 3-monooxygenase